MCSRQSGVCCGLSRAVVRPLPVFSVLQAGCRLFAIPEVRPPSPRDQLSVRRTQSCQTVVLEQQKVYLFHRFGAWGSTCRFRPTAGESEHRSTNTAWICWVCITNDGSQRKWENQRLNINNYWKKLKFRFTVTKGCQNIRNGRGHFC